MSNQAAQSLGRPPQGDAGLTRGWIMLGVGLLIAGLCGFGITRRYDRKGLHRIPHQAGEPERAAVPAWSRPDTGWEYATS